MRAEAGAFEVMTKGYVPERPKWFTSAHESASDSDQNHLIWEPLGTQVGTSSGYSPQ